jgi:hypothetical protein
VIHPAWIGPAILAASFAIGLALMISGALRLWRAAQQFSERLEKYQDLPLQREFVTMQGKVARLETRINEIPALVERAKRAVEAVQKSRRQVQAVASSFNFAAQLIRAVIEGPGPERRRSPRPEPPPSG